MNNMFFDDWQSILRAFIITILAYITLVVMIRMSGKRTLSKMNAFDFIVTVALGSCLASISLNKNIALAEGAVVYFTFISLQFIITWLSVRVKYVKNIVSSQPCLLLYKGTLLQNVMKKERITIEEIYLAARTSGIEDLAKVDAIILETTGDITVLKSLDTAEAKTLTDVKYY